MFVVGDNRTYGGYHNAPLQPGAQYVVWLGVHDTLDGVRTHTRGYPLEGVPTRRGAGQGMESWVRQQGMQELVYVSMGEGVPSRRGHAKNGGTGWGTRNVLVCVHTCEMCVCEKCACTCRICSRLV